MNFNNPYSREAYKEFFQNQFLTDDFKIYEEKLSFEFTPQYLKSAFVIGEDKSLELKVLEVLHDSENDPRVGLSKDIFRLMSSYGYKRALVLLHSSKSKNYRLSLATIELSLEGSKIKKEYSNPRRYSFFLGQDAKVKTPYNFLISKGRVKDFEDLLSRFSVEVVTKQFYQEIANWYFWAMDEVEFPDDVEKDREQRNAKNLIRLITRLIFIWFMKEKNLVPKTLFEKSFVDKVLNYKDKTGSTYYKAILQNLFFATLNTPMKKDDPNSRIFVEDAEKKGYISDAHLEQGYYRYSRFLKDKELFLKQFENVPFLNGGLFESLDKDKDLRVDCFSDNPKNEGRLKVPDKLFFLNNEIEVDLSKHLDSNKNKKVTGLFEILNRYNFTIDENTPIDQDVALDPELLGKVFENLLASYNPETSTPARKSTGSYYTPREIVDYMVEESLIEYCKRIVLDSFGGSEGNWRSEDASITLRSQEASATLVAKLRSLFDYSNDENPFKDEPEIILKLIDAIEQIKIIDPACGSGAFPMGILHKLVLALHKLDPENTLWKERLLKRVPAEIREETEKSLQNKSIDYIRKLGLIEHCIYGVDIQEIAIQISKLRFFISLLVEQQIDDTKPNRDIRALPNLETKFVAANTLVGLNQSDQTIIKNKNVKELEDKLFDVRKDLFYTNSRKDKLSLQKKEKQLRENLFSALRVSGFHSDVAEKITNWDPFDQNTHADWFDSEFMFGLTAGFDIVIGNPPYVSTKGVTDKDKKILEAQFGFADDLYNHFYFKGIQLLKDNGVLAYISSKTFWTIQTKKNLRELLLKNKLLQLVDTANPFESPMVDTCITIVKKTDNNNNSILVIDAKNNFEKRQVYKVSSTIFNDVVNNVFFIPNDFNLRVYEKLGKPLKKLMDRWWNFISTSKNIGKYQNILDEYRNNLKPGDITLLGLITEGGQGLATANNGKYVGVLEGTKYAERVEQDRPKKLWEFIQKKKPNELSRLKNKNEVEIYLNSLSEIEIRNLFDNLKEKYGRDIFGQGWLYKIVTKDEIADVEALTDDEKLNGIKGKKTFVPYDKGDKEGNRWWAPTPYYIDWSRENVKFLKENSGKKGEGMPVVRNPQFYFREGFCWTNVLNPNARLIKTKLKDKSINDVGSMSLYVTVNFLNTKFIICILNSNLLFDYYRTFINYSVNIQINDIRQLPIIIPTKEQLKEFESIFNRAVLIQKQKFSNKITEQEAEIRLNEIQRELDEKVLELYNIE
ncbi:MAG: N-6 DNA methylase [Ignavibacteriales bacterium]|nr:N-6 DNA methylase [Ignavibacteriales bacterium]